MLNPNPTRYALQKYTAFFPTLRNTNLNDIKQAAAAGGSVTEYGYYGQNTADDNSTPVDCDYVPGSNSRCDSWLLFTLYFSCTLDMIVQTQLPKNL